MLIIKNERERIMSKQNTLNILSQVEDMVGNIMESEDFTDSDIQLQKEVKAAIEWTKKASVKNTRDKSDVCDKCWGVGEYYKEYPDQKRELVKCNCSQTG